jgi:hypothetical protein
MQETKNYMIENNLFKDDKENYIYTMRSLMMNLYIEKKTTENYIIQTTIENNQKTLQDQFRKFRDYFDTS